MRSTQWLRIVCTIIVVGMIFVAGVNYFIDPGYVYFKKRSGISPDDYVQKLFISEKGFVAEEWNERAIKTSLAKVDTEIDCVIVGSSHIMQISSLRNTGNISKLCPLLLNLGVSGAGFEDLLIFSNIILENKVKPKRVFIEINPWLFKFNMDSRYKMNQVHYDSFLRKLNDQTLVKSNGSYELDLLKNLFNLEYFMISLKNYKSLFHKASIQEPKEDFLYEKGYTKAITLQDGSHVYDSHHIAKAKKTIKSIKNGGGDYKINGNIYDDYALELFEKLIILYQRNQIEINFLITPYHPSVFKNGPTKATQHMQEIENVAQRLSIKHKVKLYGSFLPENIGCQEDEFMDFMHATSNCLDRIKFY